MAEHYQINKWIHAYILIRQFGWLLSMYSLCMSSIRVSPWGRASNISKTKRIAAVHWWGGGRTFFDLLLLPQCLINAAYWRLLWITIQMPGAHFSIFIATPWLLLSLLDALRVRTGGFFWMMSAEFITK